MISVDCDEASVICNFIWTKYQMHVSVITEDFHVAAVKLKLIQCHEAKMTHFPNGHNEGPIDFFDQPF